MKEFEALVYEMDNNPEIMNYAFCDGTSMWLHLRTQLRLLYLNKVSAAQSQPQKSISNHSIYKYAINTWIRRPRLSKKKIDILCIANYEGNPEIPNRMTWFVRKLVEFSSCELMYSNNMRPLPAIKNTFNLDYYYYREVLKNKLFRRKLSEISMSNIAKFEEQVKTIFQNEFSKKDLSELIHGIYHIETVILGFKKAVKKYLEYTKPSLIVASEGNNGDWLHGTLFSVSKELKIPTAEVQHGAFNLGMKYGEKLVYNAKFVNQKTDYLFTFGPYHCTQMNVVKNCVPLGNFYLEETQKQIQPRVFDDNAIHVLFISEGIPASSINNGLVQHTAAGLCAVERKFELVIRLHPTENPNDKYNELIALKNSRYSTFENENIYQLIADSDIVIGHISTVLYEAVYFNKVNFIYRDGISIHEIPESLGSWFEDGSELASMLHKYAKADVQNTARSEYWTEGSVLSEFRKFWKLNIATN